MNADANRFLRMRGERVLHDDSPEHASLCARALELQLDEWERVVDEYAARVRPGRDDVEGRLAALAESFAPHSPCSAPLPHDGDAMRCPVCGGEMKPAVARRASDDSRALVFSRCGTCKHGALAGGKPPASLYGDPGYYDRKDTGGAGYASYLAERAYREGKGARLLDRIAALAGRRLSSMVEVGSGFGFTRRAAAARGMEHTGVDVNPGAAAAARALYGFDTLTGTLADALADGSVPPGSADLVMFQFVLEHLHDPVASLTAAASALRRGGVVAVLVPSMEAAELDVFGGSYRSLRHDHLHLFSRDSLARTMIASGLRPLAVAAHSDLHLLRGFIGDEAIATLDAAGRGPDLLGIAALESG